MINISNEHKEMILTALLGQRENFDGTDTMFAKQYGIPNSTFSQLKGGKREGLLRTAQWLDIGRRLNVSLNDRKWNIVRTDVYTTIEEEIMFCKRYSKSMMFVDECEIGKSFTAKHLSRKLKNCFYIDCSRHKTKNQLIRAIANAIGVDSTGRSSDVMENVIYYLNYLPEPIIILDEFGDVNHNAVLLIKALWNGTENQCAWYLMGADGLREKIERGKRYKKVGYAEVFSRFSSNFSKAVPTGKEDRQHFYSDLIGSVLKANLKDQSKYDEILRKCLVSDSTGRTGGLRRLESLIILHEA